MINSKGFATAFSSGVGEGLGVGVGLGDGDGAGVGATTGVGLGDGDGFGGGVGLAAGVRVDAGVAATTLGAPTGATDIFEVTGGFSPTGVGMGASSTGGKGAVTSMEPT